MAKFESKGKELYIDGEKVLKVLSSLISDFISLRKLDKLNTEIRFQCPLSFYIQYNLEFNIPTSITFLI